MKVRLKTHKEIVRLRWYDYSTPHIHLLRQMQFLVPNQDIETVDGKRVRVYDIILDDLVLRDLNPWED